MIEIASNESDSWYAEFDMSAIPRQFWKLVAQCFQHKRETNAVQYIIISEFVTVNQVAGGRDSNVVKRHHIKIRV